MGEIHRTKRDIQSAAKRELIYTKAIELFRKYGYEKTTIADICRASGMSAGSLYHFFRTKEALILQLGESMLTTPILLAPTEENLESPMKPMLNFLKANAGQWEELGVEMTTQLYRIIGERYIEEDPEPGPTNVISTLTRFISAAQDAGTIEDNMSAQEISAYFITVSRGLIYEWCLSQGRYSLIEKATAFMPRIIKTFLVEERATLHDDEAVGDVVGPGDNMDSVRPLR